MDKALTLAEAEQAIWEAQYGSTCSKPPLNPYDPIWNWVEEDPARWN